MTETTKPANDSLTPETAFLLRAIRTNGPVQDNLNETMTTGWKMAGLNWGRAIAVEAAELQNHLGWEWWKKATRNEPQAFLELVDIYHFWLSAALVHGIETEAAITSEISQAFGTNPNDPLATADMLMMLGSELAQHNALGTSPPMIVAAIGHNIIQMARHLKREPQALLDWYTGKATLNRFRRENGYKTGTYLKHWKPDTEDNVFLAEILEGPGPHTAESIHASLTALYRGLTGIPGLS